jgi:hypothetical protein
MQCFNCGGEMHGDGYSEPLVCENLVGVDLENLESSCPAPDEGPFYCYAEGDG